MSGLTLTLGTDAQFVLYEVAQPTKLPWKLQVSLIQSTRVLIYNHATESATEARLNKTVDLGRGAKITYLSKQGRKARISISAPKGIGIDRIKVYRWRFEKRETA